VNRISTINNSNTREKARPVDTALSHIEHVGELSNHLMGSGAFSGFPQLKKGFDLAQIPARPGLQTGVRMQCCAKDGSPCSCPKCKAKAGKNDEADEVEPVRESLPHEQSAQQNTRAEITREGDGTSQPGSDEAVSEQLSATEEQQSVEQQSVEQQSVEQSSGLIVDDTSAQLAEGQMTKTAFLRQLRAEICTAIGPVLARAGQTTEGCPYLNYWLDLYEQKSAAEVEATVRRYAPDSAGARTAAGYISVVTLRALRAAEIWASTGRLSGIPEGVPTTVPGEPPPQQSSAPAAQGDSVMAKAKEGGAKNVDDPKAIQQELGAGQPLSWQVRSRMEPAFGMSFSHVRTHIGAKAAGISNRVNARAFTVGNHVAFGSGEYLPGTVMGDALIAHELAHVVQQKGADKKVNTMQVKSAEYNALERDADNTAMSVVSSLWGESMQGIKGMFQNAIPALRSGLRLQGCRRENTAPAATTAVPRGTISGSVSGLRMSATATYSNCSACTDGLEAIQVFWGTRRSDGVQVGTHQTSLPGSAQTYDSFVDGGSSSPGGAVYTGNHPYYVGRPDLPASYNYVPGQSSAGSYSNCVLNIVDAPNAARLHSEAYFETAIACLNYQGSGKDKLLDSFKWGFISMGTVPKPSPSSANSSNLELHPSPSAKHEETLKADYPGYSHT
jgi:hypothetical protein